MFREDAAQPAARQRARYSGGPKFVVLIGVVSQPEQGSWGRGDSRS